MRIRINYNPTNISQTEKTIEYLRQRFRSFTNGYVYFAPIDSENIPQISSEFNDDEHLLIKLINVDEEFAGMAQLTRGNMDERSEILNKYYLHLIPLSCVGVCNKNLTIDSLRYIYLL